MFETYKPTGRVGPIFFPLLAAAVLSVIVLAYVYQLLLEWIPFIYLNALCTVGMGIALGSIGAFAVQHGNVRNVLVAGVLGVLLAASAISAKFYFQYQSWAYRLTTLVMQDNNISEDQRSEVRRALAKSLTFAEHIRDRVDQGWNIGAVRTACR